MPTEYKLSDLSEEEMTVKVLSSSEAQSNLPAILDASSEHQDTIIERANRPVAAVIPYIDYIALLDVLNQLRQRRSTTAENAPPIVESPITTNGQSIDTNDALLSLAGKFASGIADTAERAEEILEAAVNPISGLGVQ